MFRTILSTLAFAGFLAAAHPVLAAPVSDHAQAKACAPNQAARVDDDPVGFGWG